MRTSSRSTWTALWAIVSSMRLLPALVVGVGADTGSCSCPTSGFTELEEVATGTTPEETLAFVTAINSVCATPDSDSCVAPSFCQCGTGTDIGTESPADGGGTDIICRNNDGVCIDPGANGDPHMMGLRGQTFDWAGTDGEWYSMLSDGPELQLNVRVTAPQPDFPDRQLLTAVSLIFGGGSKHSLVIEVVDPHTIDNEKKCSILTDDNGGGFGVGNTLNGNGFRSEGSCLANGALRILVDGQEYPALSSPTAGVTLPDGDTVVSAMNLPAECQPFGGDKVWAEKFDHITPRARHSRRRRSLRGERSSTASAEAETFPFEEWILRSVTLAAPEWCAKFLEEEGVDGLLKVDSTHAVFRVDGPAITLRINIGTNHQDYLVLPDGKSVPEVDFWQVNVGVEAGAFSSDIAGMLGETSRVVLGVGGKPVMRGLKVLRGPVESYRVSGPLGVDFEQLHRSF